MPDYSSTYEPHIKGKHVVEHGGEWTVEMGQSRLDVSDYNDNKGPQRAVIVTLVDIDQELKLNKVNYVSISDQFGSNTDDWVGKKITLFSVEVPDPKGNIVTSYRVRP